MSLEEEVSKIFKDYAVQKVQLIKYTKMIYTVEEEGGGSSICHLICLFIFG